MSLRQYFPLFLLAAALPAYQLLDPSSFHKPSADTWPTYNGDYSGQRHSSLTQIDAANVHILGLAWMHRIAMGRMSYAQQADEGHRLKATPLLVKGVLYFTTTDNVWAIDARSGRQMWHWS